MPETQHPYDPRAHWSDLHRESSLRAVGQSALPDALNTWLYRIGRRNVRSFLGAHGLSRLDGQEVFDVGTGTGFWIEEWRSMGARRVDGCDLVPVAVERLRARFPGSDFRLGDVADQGTIPSDNTYDLVTVMNVLLHILDETRFEDAGRHVAAAVRPGGRLFLAEPALVRSRPATPLRPGATSIARPIDRYREVFEGAGLRFVAVGASTVVGSNPIEVADPHYRRYAAAWARAARWARRGPRTSTAVGVGLAIADRLLMLTGAAPSGKLILFERPG